LRGGHSYRAGPRFHASGGAQRRHGNHRHGINGTASLAGTRSIGQNTARGQRVRSYRDRGRSRCARLSSWSTQRSLSLLFRGTATRRAGGAVGAGVMSLAVRQAMGPALVAVLVAMVAGAVVAPVLSGVLSGVSAHESSAFIAPPLVVLVVALGGSYIPARRAM